MIKHRLPDVKREVLAFFLAVLVAILVMATTLPFVPTQTNSGGISLGLQITAAPTYDPTPTDCAKLDERDSTPRLISIPRAEIENNCLETISVTNDGTLGDPQDKLINIGYGLNLAPKYVAPGVAVFTCHSSFNPDKIAVCDHLTELTSGDTIIVELNSGQKKTYQVQEAKTVSLAEVNMAQFVAAITPGEESLSIMTCTGVYNMQTGDASHRLLLRASLAKPAAKKPKLFSKPLF
jgi:hypothetical protein